MKRIAFDDSWKVASGRRFGQQNEQVVDLPHDYTIGTDVSPDCISRTATAFFDGANVNYTKEFELEGVTGETILLEIDGAYMNSEVSINGDTVAHRPYGYSAYIADLTGKVRQGKNEIKISVNNTLPNSRWYTGTGLFRHVTLLKAGQVHIEPWGIFARTESVCEGNATVLVDVDIRNRGVSKESARIRICIKNVDGEIVAEGLSQAEIRPGESGKAFVRLLVENARLWDLNDPYLYTVAVEVLSDGKAVDWHEESFGIRTIAVDAKRGFRLNGKPIKLKGGCVHHDNGLLGAVSLYAAEYRKVMLHKNNGYLPSLYYNKSDVHGYKAAPSADCTYRHSTLPAQCAGVTVPSASPDLCRFP